MTYRPQFEITPYLLQLVTSATELKAWIAQAVVHVPWLIGLQQDSVARMAHSSTAIEGNQLSLPEVRSLVHGDHLVATVRDKTEVLNYVAAIRWVRTRRLNEIIRESNLLRLHGLLTQKTLPHEAVGAYKVNVNRVIDAKGRNVYLPPPPNLAGPLTRDLLAWINSPETFVLHPIITSAIAHHRMVSIHPFSDGNGRIARSLAMWLLYTRGFDTEHLFALDEFFEQDRQRYYDKIQQARDLDDVLTYWIEYVAEGIIATLTSTRNRIESLKIEHQGSNISLTRRQEDVLRLFRDKPRLRSPDIEKAFKITRARVAQIIGPLVDAGLLVRDGKTRATSYRLP